MFNKKNKLIQISFLLTTFILLFFSFNEVSAQVLPGVEVGADFFELVTVLINLLIGVAAVLAVIFITIGGLEYMTTDSLYNKEDGKEKIKNAILGLLLALISWLILYTINPSLVKFQIEGISYEQEVLISSIK